MVRKAFTCTYGVDEDYGLHPCRRTPYAEGAMNAIRRRPRKTRFPRKIVPPVAGTSEGDFEVFAFYRGSPSGGFYGTLTVVRKTDGRLLYPFEGAADIGPFCSNVDAVDAAKRQGLAIVDGDLLRPELLCREPRLFTIE